ncbi:MAG: hypothetical protein KCCBMMGE_01705 [Candidatus Methanoperedenaceae archaeon GB37]|nr:hypothetical protein DMNBHIDG_02928 [Candidatus Methanoperedenaceae archaeon GB37]CAD7783089.1 MAG: hypothetical protein KCCBMMGE_01705 [Candidatus Methanoperedenaceae archaeon GB37]
MRDAFDYLMAYGLCVLNKERAKEQGEKPMRKEGENCLITLILAISIQ